MLSSKALFKKLFKCEPSAKEIALSASLVLIAAWRPNTPTSRAESIANDKVPKKPSSSNYSCTLKVSLHLDCYVKIPTFRAEINMSDLVSLK